MPSAVYYGKKSGDKFPIAESIKYKYDKMGNICRIDENGAPVVWYKYDALNRLVREDNKTFGKTWLYSYDNKGNILCKRETSFTLKENAEESEFTSVQYEYDGDKLLSYGTEECVYDEIGNPKTYRGKSVQWANGRQMVNYSGTAFTYDGLGRRLSKGNITYTYDSNGRVIKQSNGIEFLYDNSGVAGIVYNNVTYLYRKDAQGNICALIDSSGNVVVQYKYDAWGNHAALYWNKVNDKEQYSEADEAAFDENYAHNKTLAELNPFRYRGYYYDDETGLYYLKSRYYDPETGRFITVYDISYLDPDTINGLNLYAYCGDNPVMRIDENGNKWWDWLLGVFSVVLTVVGVALTVTGVGGILGGVLISAGISSLIGGITNQAQGGSFGAGWFGGLVGGAISGVIGGIAITSIAWPILGAIGNAAGSFASTIITSGFNNGGVDFNIIKSALINAGITFALSWFMGGAYRSYMAESFQDFVAEQSLDALKATFDYKVAQLIDAFYNGIASVLVNAFTWRR